MTDSENVADPVPSDAPRLNKRTFICPFCQAFTGQVWRQTGAINGDGGFFIARQAGFGETGISMATCDKCRYLSLWVGSTMVYPQGSTAAAPHSDMPDDVLELYREAAAVLPHSRRASAALIRAALERLLKNLDSDAPKGTDLFTYIDRVAQQVSVPTRKLLTVIRHVGNTALHEKPNSAEDASVQLFLTGEDTAYLDLLFTATNDVVDELIARPKVYGSMYDSLPKSIRESVERDKP